MHFSGLLAVLAFIASGIVSAVPADVGARDIGIEARAIPDLSLDFAQWIWTGEEGSPGGGAPVGWRGFRKNISHIQTGCPVCVTFAIASDNGYIVYVNGEAVGDNLAKVGSTLAFLQLDVYSVALNPGGANVIAVNSTNIGSAASVVVTGIVQYGDGSEEAFVSDNSWLAFPGASPPAGFQNPLFVDAGWTPASQQGFMGSGPWGDPSILPFTGTECQVFTS